MRSGAVLLSIVVAHLVDDGSSQRDSRSDFYSSPLGVIFSALHDANDYYDSVANEDAPSNSRPPLLSSSREHTVNERKRKFFGDFDTVADKANDFLEELISFIGGRRGVSPIAIRRGYSRPATDRNPSSTSLSLGEHVCVRESEVDVPYEFDVAKCANLRRATRCASGNANSTLLRIVECCEGYNTDDIRQGCTHAFSPRKLGELLEREEACLEGFDVSQTTVLLTRERFCSSENGSNVNVGDYLLNGVLHDYELLNGQKIPTKSGGTVIVEESADSSKRPLLNCVELQSEETTKDGILFYLERLPAISHKNLLQSLTDRGEFTVFIEVLGNDLREVLGSESLFTVFPFTDSAFSALSPSLQSRIQQRRGCAKDVMKDHIYKGIHCSARLEGSLVSLNGHSAAATKEIVNGTLFIRIGNARIIGSEEVATNGVFHPIDDVILSEKLVDWREHLAIYEEEFLKLLEEVIPSDMEPAAIFVPPKESFQDLEDKKSFVENHIVLQRSSISNVSVETALGSKIPACIAANRDRWFGCSASRKSSVEFCGTSIHFIRKPLPVVRSNLLQLLGNRSDLSAFSGFFMKSEIAKTADFENDGLYTVFAPSDDSFSKNQLRSLQQNTTLAEKFVRRHIFKGFLCSVNLFGRRGSGTPKVLENIQQEYYAGRTEGGKVIVGDSIVQEEVIATNGVVHVLESALKAAPLQRVVTSPFSNFFNIFD